MRNPSCAFALYVKPFRLSVDEIVVTLSLMGNPTLMKGLRTPYNDIARELPPAFDRRDRERVAVKIPLRVLSYGPLMEKSDDAVCTDLSEGGVSLETEAQLNVGEIVILEFRLKGEAAYRCHARLTYRMGRRYGGYFLGGQ